MGELEELAELNKEANNLWEEQKKKITGWVEGYAQGNSQKLLDHYSKYVAPEIAGNHEVKKAILLQLISRDSFEIEIENHDKPRNIPPRGRIHIGLVGEPGTGKTILMEALARDFDALYLTSDTKKSSLKGDARRKDYGVQIINQQHEGLLCIDEIELMGELDREGGLRDVMENGYIVMGKGGKLRYYKGQVKLIIGSNTVMKLSKALIDRLDFMFMFQIPTKEESKQIARKVVAIYAGRKWRAEIQELQNYIRWCMEWKPEILEEDEEKINNWFDEYFSHAKTGRTGRWITKILRVAFGLARLRHGNVTYDDIKNATQMIHKNEKEYEEASV